MRRRLRERRRVREALLLDLGALVYELHRQGKRAPELLQQKAAELTIVDEEVRELQAALGGSEERARETTEVEAVAGEEPGEASALDWQPGEDGEREEEGELHQDELDEEDASGGESELRQEDQLGEEHELGDTGELDELAEEDEQLEGGDSYDEPLADREEPRA
jgi:hypothetical protein